MTSETRERIKQYEGALPHIKEKITAAAVLLVIAMTIMVTATYAWITLSTSPEVTSIDTTVAANGALEIAMANGTGAAPGRSAAGDSTGKDNNVVRANNTWGNLVNLSDPSYGLARITLRPAALKGTMGLLSNPLYGVEYGDDGRVTTTTDKDTFAYMYFDKTEGDSGEFLWDKNDDHLGVRAISTVQYSFTGGNEVLRELRNLTNRSLTSAVNNYATMTNENKEPGKTYITALQGLIQTYAQGVIDKKVDDSIVTDYVPDIYEMLQYFYDNVMVEAGKSYVGMANMLDLMKGDNQGSLYSQGDVEGLVADYKSGKIKSYVKENITGLDSFVKDYRSLQSYLKKSETGDFTDLKSDEQKNSLAYWAYQAKNGVTITWKDIKHIVNWACDIGSATLDGYRISSIGITVGNKILNNPSPHKAVLHAGAIWRMEERIGARMNPLIKVTVTMIISKSLEARVTTDVSCEATMVTDTTAIEKLNTGSFKGDTATAGDTYALAVDLWLRTNAGSPVIMKSVTVVSEDGKTVTTTDPICAYLTLEGKVITQESQEREMVKAPDGTQYEAFTGSGTVRTEEGTMTVEDLVTYKKGNGSYYYIDTEKNEEVQIPDNWDMEYTPRMKTIIKVVGYDGVNRVWDDEQMAQYEDIEGTSTTQGGGSCYTFYASTPADQSRFLELLESMRVAFIDGKGNLIGAATMDIANYYAENGKVTVPLALDTGSAINLGDDGNGNTIYGLMPLVKNAATRVTAIVYLDGTKLTNEMVLASGDIQGNLNVQFGSYTAAKVTTTTVGDDGTSETETKYVHDSDNESIENEPVMQEKIAVSAEVTGDVNTEYDPDKPASIALKVKVEGATPKVGVDVRFIRAISSTQGVLQDKISLSGSNSEWSGTIEFNRPGNYILRTVWVDGSEYDLADPINVTVTGTSVSSLACELLPVGSNYAKVMTADAALSTKMTLGFTSSAQIPSRVNGIFMDENGRQVTVPFRLEAGQWVGTATFYTSGTYTMKYVEIDGEIYELQSALQPTLELLLGLKTSTAITATPETLAILQAINAKALPTRFVLNTSARYTSGTNAGQLIIPKDENGNQGITLNVSTKVYDNSGNEIEELTNVRLYYGRTGSALNGLDANLKWNASTGTYVGSFFITKAGTFSFTKVTVEQTGKVSTINAKTEAPSIQVMPPDDASYFDSHTESYQFAPNRDAVMELGIAYSGAATKGEATITDGKNSYTVEGTMGTDDTLHGKEDVTMWKFKVPDTDGNGLQEGNWQLTDITLYGVYYNKQYVENGVKIDLKDKGITSKVVNNVYVTYSSNSRVGDNALTGYFMDDHKVSGMTLTIEDFEGMPIQKTIGDVKVVYKLNETNTSAYGYTTDKTNVTVNGSGSLRRGSETVYDISEMNFQNAGMYDSCSISFSMDNLPVGAGDSYIAIKYKDGEAISTSVYPRFEVKWHAPDVKIIGTNPARGVTFNVNMGGSLKKANLSMQNYYEDYYVCLGIADTGLIIPNYTVPQVTLKLENGGKSYQSATFEAHTKINETITCGFSFPTGKDAPTVTGYMGRIGNANSTSGRDTRGSVNETISIITMQYGGVDYVLNLANPITIKTVNSAKPRLDYIVPEEYAGYITLPATKGGQNGDGRNFKETLPGNISFTIVEQPEVSKDEMGTPKTSTTTTNLYYSVTESGCGGDTTTYYPVTRTVETKVYQKELPVNSNQYTVTSWNIEKAVYNTESSDPLIKEWSKGGTYKPGNEITVDKHMRATPVAEITSTSVGETRLVTYTVITTTDKKGKGTSSKPSGTEIDQSAVLTKPEVVETWS